MALNAGKFWNDEQGFWSALVILFLVTLALMGAGSSALIRGEGANVANQAEILQADYAANGAAYYGMKRLALGPLDETTPIAIGNVAVTLDTSEITGSSDILLTITATIQETQRIIDIRLRPGGGLVDKAIWTTGHVFNVSGKDSTGATDSDMVVSTADSVPTIREDSLAAMSTAQGHNKTMAEFDPADGYPAGSFYQPDGITPAVTHITHNFRVRGGRTVYGIFVVEGNVTLNGSARIEGIIYLPNVTSTIITGGGDPDESTITGGIVSHGNITGFGNHISVQHVPEYMQVFCGFQAYDDAIVLPVVSWSYR